MNILRPCVENMITFWVVASSKLAFRQAAVSGANDERYQTPEQIRTLDVASLSSQKQCIDFGKYRMYL